MTYSTKNRPRKALKVITCNLATAALSKFDELVSMGLIASRSEGIRAAVNDYVDKMDVVKENLIHTTVRVVMDTAEEDYECLQIPEEHYIGEQMINKKNMLMEWARTTNQAGKDIEQWKCIGRLGK